MELVAARKPTTRRKKKIPSYLIYEIMDGKPIYYKGYKAFLNGNKKTIDEIMGSSSLQPLVLSFLAKTIFKFIDDEKYYVLINEPGIHLNTNNNLSGDILIYENSVLTPEKINTQYANVPALVHIEVDVTADLEDYSSEAYMTTKVKKLLAFGTQKVIWIFTGAKSILVATSAANWQWIDWNKDIEIMEGHTFNIGQYLAQQGIQLD